jgi:RecA/RadA recombinase
VNIISVNIASGRGKNSMVEWMDTILYSSPDYLENELKTIRYLSRSLVMFSGLEGIFSLCLTLLI